jgi:hypothetical protein
MIKKVIILFGVILTSCGGLDKDECLANVKRAFPKSQIWIPYQGSVMSFIVVDSTGITKVVTGNFSNSNITSVNRLKRVQ